MGITVLELYSKPFVDRSLQDQIRIVMEGPSRPKFNSLPIVSPDFKVCQFEELIYGKAQWVTGCPYRNGFFCWTCLLFGKAKWVYIRSRIKSGYSELTFLVDSMREHEKTPEHIESEFVLKLFCMRHLKSAQVEMDINETNDNQTDVLKRLIDVVFKKVVQEANHRTGNYYGQLNVEDCVKLLQLTRIYDTRHFAEIDCTIELLKNSPKIISDIVNAMTKVVKLAIKKETQLSTFVSLILSEHSEIPSESSVVSTVLRHIRDGRVCERFVGFNPCSNERTADDLCKHIGNTVVEFDIAGKFLAYSVDGAIQPLFQFLKLVDDLKLLYPSTFFVPWYAHSLEHVMQQSLSYYKECNHFFKNLNSLENYFIKNYKLWQAFEDLMHGKHYTLINFDWFIKSQTIDVLHTHRTHFVEFFELVARNSKKWDADDVVRALGFKWFLQEFLTVFLLQVFATLLDIMDEFRRSFQEGDTPSKILNSGVFKDLIKNLIAERGKGFEEVWSRITSVIDDGLNIPKTKRVYNDYRELYKNIFYRTIRDLETRFEAISKFELPCCITVGDQSTQDTYIDLYMGQQNAHGPLIEREVVDNEVAVLRKKASEFPLTSLEDLYQYFLEANIKDAMPLVFKLAEFTLTLPVRRPFCGKCRLQEIMSEPFNAKEVFTSGDICVLCVELDILQDLKKADSFYNDVISAFDARDRTVD